MWVEHPHVEDYLIGLAARRTLEAQAHPSMGLVECLVGACRHRVGKGKKRPLRPALLVKTLDEQVVFVIEHLAKPLATHKARALAVDGIREGHVIRGDRLGNRSRRSAHVEKPARHLLTSTYLGKGPVNRLRHVDLEGLLVHLHIKLIDHCSSILRRGRASCLGIPCGNFATKHRQGIESRGVARLCGSVRNFPFLQLSAKKPS